MEDRDRSSRGKPRNPDWSRDETILLFDLYRRVGNAGARHVDVIALSNDLNRMARSRGDAPLPNFRNPAGIAMRLRNIGGHDPGANAARQGLRPGGAIDVQIWHDFASDPDGLAREVMRIQAAITAGGVSTPTMSPSRAAKSERRALRRYLPAEIFAPVAAEHLLTAANMLADGFADHPFPRSTDYDVLFGTLRLPPKALFGVAARLALGRPIAPADFRGGLGTLCFRRITAAGYTIVAKSIGGAPEEKLSSDDRTWSEGEVRLVTHLERERGPGLAAAKRSHFRNQHGRLYCERCFLDPIKEFGGPDGEACIEVHHDRISIAAMDSGHRTRLEDLRCLCANCHRFVHHRIKQALQSTGRFDSP